MLPVDIDAIINCYDSNGMNIIILCEISFKKYNRKAYIERFIYYFNNLPVNEVTSIRDVIIYRYLIVQYILKCILKISS